MRSPLLALVLAPLMGCAAPRAPAAGATAPPAGPAGDAPADEERAALDRVETLIGQDRLEEAEAAANAVVATTHSSDAYDARGRVRMFRGNHADAVEDMRKAVTMSPRETYFRINLAEALENAAREPEALSMIRDAIERDPRSTRALRVQGRLLRSQLALAEAERSYRAAIAIDPNDGESWLALSILDGMAGRFVEAEVSAARATAVAPEKSLYWIFYAQALHRNGKLAEAATAYETAIAKAAPDDPRLAGIYRSLSATRSFQKQYALAAIALRRSLELTPADDVDRPELVERLAELEALSREASRAQPPDRR